LGHFRCLGKICAVSEASAEFSWLLEVATLPNGVSSVTIEADRKQCSAIAERLNLDAINQFKGKFSIVPEDGGSLVHISGKLLAVVSQTCSVTLEPLISAIDVSVEWRFADGDYLNEESPEFDVDGEDPPEPMTDGNIDLGETMVQQLALEVESFPRTKGLPLTEYTTEAVDSAATATGNDASGNDNPFHALKQLKEKLD